MMTAMSDQDHLTAYAQCYDQSPVAFCVIDMEKDDEGKLCDFSFVYVNKSLAQLEEKSIDDLLGEKFYHVFNHTDEKWLEFYGAVAYEGRPDNITAYSPEIRKYLHIQCYQISEGRCGCILTDVTEQKNMEEMLDMQRRYTLAIRGTNVIVWEYDVPNRRLILPENEADRMALQRYNLSEGLIRDGVIENVPESLMSSLFREEDRQAYRRVFEDIHAGKPYTQADVWLNISENPDSPPTCERVCYSTICDEEGKPIRSYGMGQDITSIKLEEEAYQRFMQTLIHDDPHFLFALHLNLSKDLCCSGQGGKLRQMMELPDTASEAMEELKKLIILPEERITFEVLFDRNHLKEAFYNGQFQLSGIYRFRLSRSKTHWIELSAHTLHNPRTGDLETILYAVDCNEEKISEAIIQRFAREEFDYTVLIDVQKKHAESIRIRENLGRLQTTHGRDNPVWLLATNQETIIHSQEHTAPVSSRLDDILSRLTSTGSYAFIYLVRDKDGNELCKQAKYCYLDKTRQEILLIRTDVTKAVMQEKNYVAELQKRSEKLLRIAMEVNEQAKSTKIQLLSRASRDFWGPVRAIEQVVTEGTRHVDDPAYMEACLGTIAESCSHLTTVSKEILDVLGVETGKLDICCEKFKLAQLLAEINTIISPQAKSLSLDFSIQQGEGLKLYYVSDIQRLRQIILQLISNALKFTPPGGSISLTVGEEPSDTASPFLKFTICDSGIGMSEEFMNRHLYSFRPGQGPIPEQASSKWLGLFLTYNLIHLMGGTVELHSQRGVGTTVEFTIPVGE